MAKKEFCTNHIGLNKPGKRTGVMNEPKPYEGYRQGRGMPSANEPQESYTEQGRVNHEKAFGENKEWYEKRDEKLKVCRKSKCDYFSTRKYSGCVMFKDIRKCMFSGKKRKK